MPPQLAQYGLPGLIIFVLCGVIVKREFLVQQLYKEKSDLQDKRLEDATANRDKYDAVMGKFSQSFDLFVAKLDGERSKD